MWTEGVQGFDRLPYMMKESYIQKDIQRDSNKNNYIDVFSEYM